MRRKRFSFLAGWAAVAVLAVAGFAAFGNFGGPDSQEVQNAAAAASLGHASGAYAGVAFAHYGGSDDVVVYQAVPSANDDSPASGALTTEEEEPEAKTTTTSIATATSTPKGGWLSEVQVRALISLHFRPTDVNRAIRVAWCESRFNPSATNMRTGAVGLFQHLPRYWEDRAASAGFRGAEPSDPEASIAAAAWEVYEGGGWELFCRG